jgi:hypothetical protein
MVYQPYVTFGIAGSADIRIKGYGITLTIPSIKIDKQIQMNGFGGPPTIDVIDFAVTVNHNNEVKGVITADVHNPSNIDMALGMSLQCNPFIFFETAHAQ